MHRLLCWIRSDRVGCWCVPVGVGGGGDLGLVAPALVAVRLVRGRDPDARLGADLARLRVLLLADELLLLAVPLGEAALAAQLGVVVARQVQHRVGRRPSKVVAQRQPASVPSFQVSSSFLFLSYDDTTKSTSPHSVISLFSNRVCGTMGCYQRLPAQDEPRFSIEIFPRTLAAVRPYKCESEGSAIFFRSFIVLFGEY